MGDGGLFQGGFVLARGIPLVVAPHSCVKTSTLVPRQHQTLYHLTATSILLLPAGHLCLAAVSGVRCQTCAIMRISVAMARGMLRAMPDV